MFHYQSDNMIMNFLSRVFDLMFLGMICFVGCLPVVTIGVSLAALYRVMSKTLHDHGNGVFREFVCAWKENFRTATLSWLPLLMSAVLLALNFELCFHMEEGLPRQLWLGLLTFCAVLWLVLGSWIFPVIARFKVTVREAFPDALLFAGKHPAITAGVLFFWILDILLILYLSWFSFPFVAAGLYIQNRMQEYAFLNYWNRVRKKEAKEGEEVWSNG